MADTSGADLFEVLRARGLRKKVAKSVAALDGRRSEAGADGERLARQAIEDLTFAAEEIRRRVLRSDPKRVHAAKKAAQTRASNAAKRKVSAKKGAQTRAKVTRARAGSSSRRA